MANRDTTMYRDMNDQEIEHLESKAVDALHYTRDFELDTGMSRIDPSSYEPPNPTHRRR
jgi:hypothetical protein